jgi:hypothetical protein
VAWRSSRRLASENPIQWADKVPQTAKVVALTGTADTFTSPDLAKSYVDKLRARNVDAKFQTVPGAGHVNVLASPLVLEALSAILRR